MRRFLIALAIIAALGGCSALDSLAPQYAAKSAGAPPGATTQPTATRSVSGEIGTVLVDAAGNPLAQSVATISPLAGVGLTLAGAIGATLIVLARKPNA